MATEAKRRPRRVKLKPEDVHAAVKDCPLVGLKACADILGIAAPNVSRLKRDGRMPRAVPVEGSADVYVRSEVVALRKQMDRERRRDNGR